MAAIPNPADDPGEENPTAPVLIAPPRLDPPRLDWSELVERPESAELDDRAHHPDAGGGTGTAVAPEERSTGPASPVSVPPATPVTPLPPPTPLTPVGTVAPVPPATPAPDEAPDASAGLPEQVPLAPPAPDWVSAWRPPAFGISPLGPPLDPSPGVPQSPVAVATPGPVPPAARSGSAGVAAPARPVEGPDPVPAPTVSAEGPDPVPAPTVNAFSPAAEAGPERPGAVLASPPAAGPPPAAPVRRPLPPGAAPGTAPDTADLPRVGRPVPQHRTARTPATPLPHPRGARRLRDPIGSWRRIRSGIELLVMTLVLGVLLAAVLAAAIGAMVVALQHALNG